MSRFAYIMAMVTGALIVVMGREIFIYEKGSVKGWGLLLGIFGVALIFAVYCQ